MSEPDLPKIGDLIGGKYRIEALIGQGGMGVVFEVTHVQMESRFAIKWLLPRLAHDPNAVRRFLSEAKIASRIKHANVVSPIDVSVETGAPYIVMELLEGETLEAHLGNRALRLDEAMSIFVPVLQGVAAAHAHHIVHRDLKPANIFLARTSGGTLVPKVLDFGIAKRLDPNGTQGTLTDHGSLLGTIQYMAPEQLQDASNVGPPADVYALGVILYRMLAGRLPYEGNLLDLALRIREGRPTPLRARDKSLAEGLDAAVMCALAPSLQTRFPDVASFAGALEPHVAQRSHELGRLSKTVPNDARSGPSAASATPSVAPAHGSSATPANTPPRRSERDQGRPPAKDTSTFHPVSSRTPPASMSGFGVGAIFFALLAASVSVVLLVRHSKRETNAPTTGKSATTVQVPMQATPQVVQPVPPEKTAGAADAGTTSGWTVPGDSPQPGAQLPVKALPAAVPQPKPAVAIETVVPRHAVTGGGHKSTTPSPKSPAKKDSEVDLGF